MTILGELHMLAKMILWLPGPGYFFWALAGGVCAISFALASRRPGSGSKRAFWLVLATVGGLVVFERVGTWSLSASDGRFVSDLAAVGSASSRDELTRLTLRSDGSEERGSSMHLYYRYRGFGAWLDRDKKSIDVTFDAKGRIIAVATTGRSS